MSSGQGNLFIGPYDPAYPIGWYGGMTLDIDPLPQSIPPDLGAHWMSFSLGDYTQQWDIVQGGGFNPKTFRSAAQESWGSVTLRRPWFPNGSAAIAGWMDFAKTFGPCTVTITVAVNPSAGEGVPGSEKLTFVFHNSVPTNWKAPNFAGPRLSSNADLAYESITFQFAGYDISSTDSKGSTIAPTYTYKRTKAPQARLRILLGGAIAAEPLAALTAWNRAGTVLGLETNIGNQAVAALSQADPAVEFWLPPQNMQIQKGSSWATGLSPAASASGPVQWQGTQPMSISFNYTLTSMPSEVFQVKNAPDGYRPTKYSSDDKSDWDNWDPSISINPDDPESLFTSGTSIQPQIDQLLSLLEADQLLSLVPGLNMPPLVIFEFGNFISPVCYVTNVSMTVDQFDSNGNPRRASGSITIQQYPIPESLQNPTSGGLVSEEQAQLYPGDCLAHIAYRYYRSPARWRDLAESNDIDDPMRVANGSRLAVPNVATLPARTEGGVVRARKTIQRALPGKRGTP
jgi:hypothetical protein